jgi:hypothetical protein
MRLTASKSTTKADQMQPDLAQQFAEQFVTEQLQDAYLALHRARIEKIAGISNDND